MNRIQITPYNQRDRKAGKTAICPTGFVCEYHAVPITLDTLKCEDYISV